MVFDDRQLRRTARNLGLGAAAFGVLPALAPRLFGRLFGMGTRDPRTLAAYRSIGVRDIVLGIGLSSAATHAGGYTPWVLARAVSDGGDVVACLVAIAAGSRNPRFVLLTGLAFGAAVNGFRLWLRLRASSRGVSR